MTSFRVTAPPMRLALQGTLGASGGVTFTAAPNYIKRMAWYVPTDSAHASLIAQFDYATYSVAPLSGNAAYNAQTDRIKAINPNIAIGNYTIAYEIPHAGNELQGVSSITRSGTTVTVNTCNRKGVPEAPKVTNGATAWIWQAGVTAYNGSWTVTSVGATSYTFTASGPAATAANDTSGQALTAKDASVIRYIMNGQRTGGGQAYTGCTSLGDNPSFFVWKQGTSGRRTFWGPYENYHMNPTEWASPDANGLRWGQWWAKWLRFAHLNANVGSTAVGLKVDFLFKDNHIPPRVDDINDGFTFSGFSGLDVRPKMDWKRLGGTNWQNYNDPGIIAAVTQGLADAAQALRDYSTSANGADQSQNLFIMGNADTLSGTPLPSNLAGSVESAYLELFMDIRNPGSVTGTTSLAAWVNTKFADQMTGLIAMGDGGTSRLRSHAKSHSFLHVYLTNKNDYAAARMACAIAMLRNSTGVVIQALDDASGTGGKVPTVYDEFSIDFGLPVDPAQTAAYSGTLWKRAWTKALPLVNAGAADQTIDLTGQGWRFHTGILDTTVNSGALVTGVLTVPARSAYILVKP